MNITKHHLIIAAKDFQNVYNGEQGDIDLSYYDTWE